METSAKMALILPERGAPNDDSFDCRPKAVEDWLQNLPVANLGETSRRVYEALHGVNRLEIRPALRLGFLEQLREIVQYIVEGLRKRYQGRELPLKRKPRQVVELATMLLGEMALGYEILAQSARQGSRGFGRRSLAQSLDRALRYRGRLLVENWIVYLPAPGGTWARIHGLYAIAESSDIAETSVPEPLLASRRGRSTPATAYKHILLLAATGPTRLQQGETADVYSLLQHWADRAELLPSDKAEGADGGLFRVPRRDDRGPHPSLPEFDHADDRILVTLGLVRTMQRELAKTSGGVAFWRRKPLADMHPELSRRVMLALGAVPARRHRRVKAADSQVHIVAGLSRIHRHLLKELGRKDEVAESSRDSFHGRDVRDPRRNDTDVWDLVYPSEYMKMLEAQESRRHHGAPAKEAETQWDLVNVSAGGYCLLSDPAQAIRVQVGELLAIRETGEHELPWQLCTVRWLRAADGIGLQVGVELLGPKPSPVALRGEQENGDFGPLDRGLLLPSVAATEQPPTLVVPPLNYSAGRGARLRVGRRETPVLLERILDSTEHYRQFQFRRADALDRDDELESMISAGI